MSATQRLAELGLPLPAVAVPVADYVPAARCGQQIVTAGQLPLVEGHLQVTGHVGAEVDVETAAGQARIAALNAVAAAAAEAGGIDAIRAVVKVVVFVSSAPDFTGQAAVANGASELLGQIFGEAGRHARSAVGVVSLPLASPVEVELTVQV